MAANETRRLNPTIQEDDVATSAALKDIADYTPANPAYTKAKVQAAYDAMVDAQDLEVQKQAAADAARDDAAKKEWAFHNVILGVKEQVRAQYGADSNELQGIGLKKKSEKAKPGTKTKTKTPPKP